MNRLKRITNLRAKLRIDDHRALWVLLGFALLLRIAVMVFYTSAVFNYHGGDSARYMRLEVAGTTELFGDIYMPAGYPAFLMAVREVSSWFPLTIVVQHLLGLAVAVLLYAAVCRAGVPRWAALLPAVVVAFSGDQLFLEHAILTEALWIPALALSMYLLARSLSSDKAIWWLAGGGATLMLSALVRNVSLALPVLLGVWAVFALPGKPLLRLRYGAAVLAPAVLVLILYLAIAKSIVGGHSGLFEDKGFVLYGRVGQFADCTKFTPPEEARVLCVDTPAAKRPGPLFWTFGAESPLLTRFQFDTGNSHQQELLAEFGREAIIHQPIEYLTAVTRDFLRYFAPDVGHPRPFSGITAESMSFASNSPSGQTVSLNGRADQVRTLYSGVGVGESSHGVRMVLGTYQSIFRIQGLLTVLLIALTIVGVALGRGKIRAGAWLFLISGMTLLAIPPAVSSYDVRYAVPPIDLLAAGAAFGLAAIAGRGLLPTSIGAARSGPDR